MPKSRVLIVEDDRSLAEILEYNLRKSGYEVSRASDGGDGLDQAKLKLPDIILLDVMLPVIDGLEVCRRLRANPDTAKALIIMLTAKSEEADQLVGYSVGADDYVVKPFSVKVLLERLKAVERRRTDGGEANPDIVIRGPIAVDRRRYRVTVNGENLELTKSEFRLLDTLVRQPGRAFDRTELIDSALGEDTFVLERTIDVHIRALRRKLDAYAEMIETVRGVGYRFKEIDSAELT